MRDEKTAAIIHENAERIMLKIRCSQLYGEPIDQLNPDEIIYSAYLVGCAAEAELQSNTGDELRAILLARKP